MKNLLIASFIICIQASHAAAKDDLVRVGDFFYRYAQIGAVGYTYWNHGAKGSLGCAAGSLANNYATDYLKRTINQRRPNGRGRGMPSGHTSRVASAFGCLLGQEGFTAPTVALGAATVITAYSRVEGDYHTVEQVLVGAVLGTALGYLGTQHLYVSPTEIQVTLPIGGRAETGPEVAMDARKSLIDFANDR
jgi:membrane-associated phospholipid phosphatase